MQQPTKSFSGGWRMRISLAQALFVTPDLLLLDEPTNHLDVFACTWLEQFLNAWERTVIIVSHDRGFLNRVTRNTIFVHRQRLWYYGGSYDTYVTVIPCPLGSLLTKMDCSFDAVILTTWNPHWLNACLPQTHSLTV